MSVSDQGYVLETISMPDMQASLSAEDIGTVALEQKAGQEVPKHESRIDLIATSPSHGLQKEPSSSDVRPAETSPDSQYNKFSNKQKYGILALQMATALLVPLTSTLYMPSLVAITSTFLFVNHAQLTFL